MNRDGLAAPELLPCPFCGGKPYLANVAMVGCAYVVCTDCRTQGDDASQERAIAAWNRRATPAALAASPEVQAMIAAEGKLWERAIANYCDLITIEDVEDYVAKARAEAAALRKGETT